LSYFKQYQERLSKLIGPAEAKRLVNNGIVLITLGGNDFVNNYYLVPYSARSREFALPDYIRYVISEYKKILAVCNSFSDIYFFSIIITTIAILLLFIFMIVKLLLIMSEIQTSHTKLQNKIELASENKHPLCNILKGTEV
jgi:membrane protein insertase Oxa1/YidC/SpoIIIJ